MLIHTEPKPEERDDESLFRVLLDKNEDDDNKKENKIRTGIEFVK